MAEKFISVVTLTWNSKETIKETVESVLSQNYENFEHVIIDNVSSDETLEIVKSLYNKCPEKLRIISEKDQGISDGFNKGIQNSKGEIVVFLNSDDTYETSNVLSKVNDAFQDDDVMYVHGDMIFEDDQYGTNRRKPLLCSLEVAMPYNHPTFFVRRELYDKHGLFDLKYKYTMDFHFICRLYKSPTEPKYKSVYISDEPLVRMKAGGVSWKYEMNSLDELKGILSEFNFYGPLAAKSLRNRKIRIKLREALQSVGLAKVVALWRKLKWS
jgi:glycosyltransferase involved in cell wall biosynthesis